MIFNLSTKKQKKNKYLIQNLNIVYIIFQYVSENMKPNQIIPDQAFKMKINPKINSYTERDSIIYALGIGFSQNPLKKQDFKYTSEFDQNFKTFPTYYTCLSFLDLLQSFKNSNGIPKFDPSMILHAQQRIQLFKTLQPEIQYIHHGSLIDVVDKGKFALLAFNVNTQTKNANGKMELVAKSQSSMVIKGLGGFGFKGKNTSQQIPPKPTRNSDVVFEDSSFPGQAFLYRLSGDNNPLHIIPQQAAKQKFQRPIIHGLASYGIVARVLVEKLLGGDSNRLKVFHTRFVGHVFPGESYKIQVWKENGYFWFNASIIERGKSCLYGYLVYHPETKL